MTYERHHVASKKKQIRRAFNVRLSEREKRDLDRLAAHEDRTTSDTIRLLIRRALKEMS
jgi:predicted DNA-binding protein